MIKHKFPTKDLGEAKSILSFEIHCNQSQGHIYILQQGKINNILKTFGLINCKPIPTPMLTSTALNKPTNNNPIPDFPYQQAIRMLSCLAHASRPNILFTVMQASQFITQFNHQHVTAVHHIMHYLAGTHNLAICYNCQQFDQQEPDSLQPTIYCDTDWGGNLLNRKSVTGLTIFFIKGPIYWSSKLR
jgi:hypothetical protein